MAEFKKSFIVAIWFMVLTFPFVAMKVDSFENIVTWRWDNVLYMGVGCFFISWLWRYLLQRKEFSKSDTTGKKNLIQQTWKDRLFSDPKVFCPVLIAAFCIASVFPFIFSPYQTTIMTTALIYVVLGLGLNIVVGLAGLLDLGYVAFYAVGAYSYALFNYYYGFGFWAILPVGAVLAGLCGVILGVPVLRLRGDYLAIVTLGFGEIIRLVLENWDDVTFGPQGIPNIPKPNFFGLEMDFQTVTLYMYFVVFAMTIFTIVVVRRLNNSRIGRAWIALREDEIACQAMGIDTTKTKLTAFGLGACWAGMMGVFFAAKNSFVNPHSFTFIQSAMILCIVVLGGMGSIIGAILAALILILLPEYLRAFSEYRMLIFGGIMIIMMVFRPEGLISNVRRKYELHEGEKH